MPFCPTEKPAADATVDEILRLLRAVIYAPEGRISAETRLEDLGLDSLDLFEAGLEIEEMLGRDAAAAAAALHDVRTVGDFARCFAAPPAGTPIPLAA